MRRSSNGAKNTRFKHPHAHICRHAPENPQNRAAVYHYAAHSRLPSHQRPPSAAYAPDWQTSPTIFRDFFPNRLDHGRVFNWFRPRILCTNSFLGPKGESEMTKISPLEGLQGRKKEFLPWDLKGELLPWGSQRAGIIPNHGLRVRHRRIHTTENSQNVMSKWLSQQFLNIKPFF